MEYMGIVHEFGILLGWGREFSTIREGMGLQSSISWEIKSAGGGGKRREGGGCEAVEYFLMKN